MGFGYYQTMGMNCMGFCVTITCQRVWAAFGKEEGGKRANKYMDNRVKALGNTVAMNYFVENACGVETPKVKQMRNCD